MPDTNRKPEMKNGGRHTGSSYKLVMGRDVNVMSTATTQFLGMPDSLPLVPTSSDFGEQHQVETGSRNCTPNRKH